MGKTLTLKLSGLWPSPNDYTVKEGALDVGDNIVVDQTDLGESRRGFEVEIDNSGSSLDGYLLRSFTATAPEASSYNLLTYRLNEASLPGILLLNDEDTISGDKEFNPPSPSTVCRMLNWGKYIYVAADTGIKRYSAALNSSVPAGIPQALDLVLALTGSSGFFVPNQTATITATRTSGSANLTTISSADIANVLIGQTVSGTGIPVGTTVSSISLSTPVVIYSSTLTAGSTVIVVPANTGIAVNQLVSGEGIPTNTRVASISGTNITLTGAVIITGTEVITFSTDNTVTMSANATSGAPTVTTVAISDGGQVAYRLIWGLQNENKATSVGAPSGFATISNNTGGSRNVIATATIPQGITTDYFYQLYRSAITPSLAITPADQMQLVSEGVPSAMDLSNGYIQITDQTPESLKGESLYTGTDQEGITQANYPPPIAVDICNFREGYVLYSNYTLPNQLKLAIDGVGAPSGVQVNDQITFSDGTSPFTVTGKGTENIASGEFAVVTTGTPAQNIADTAASFIRVVNRYSSNTIVYIDLLSGPNELPGQMLIRARATIGSFTVVASAHGTAWTPDIDTTQTSEAETKKNGILVAKAQQPEAVPRVNLFLVGGLDNEILRTIPLRDYTIILTVEGIYRMTGQTITDFVVAPFDLTVVCVAPETARALGNECWCLTTQGVVSISDGGVRMRSALQLNSILLSLTRSAPISVQDVSFAVGYESDQRYILALPQTEGDTTCTQQYCYNYITDRWTRWTRNCTAGYVNTKKGLYLGNGNNNNIVKERKNGNYTDYVDESFEVQITAFSNLVVTLNTVSDIVIGDILWQDHGADGIVSSEVVDIDVGASTVTLNSIEDWDIGGTPGDTRIYTAIENVIQWKPNPAGDPSEAKQYSEGQILFRQPRFSGLLLQFATDISPGFDSVDLVGLTGGGLGWGGGGFGMVPWGGTVRPKSIRFYIPPNKQYAGVLIPRMTIRSGYANWQLEGIELIPFDIGYELGGPTSE